MCSVEFLENVSTELDNVKALIVATQDRIIEDSNAIPLETEINLLGIAYEKINLIDGRVLSQIETI